MEPSLRIVDVDNRTLVGARKGLILCHESLHRQFVIYLLSRSFVRNERIGLVLDFKTDLDVLATIGKICRLKSIRA